MLINSGRVEHQPRAFQQDAHEAMRGDIVRGLIELITNADDAYVRMGETNGKLTVEVEHRRGSTWRVVVRDRATGMSQEEMEQRLKKLGGQDSGFEQGNSVRGNLGRGAKDLVSFGTVRWESVKDGNCAVMEIAPDGTVRKLPKRMTATHEVRTRLGITRKNGTVVTMQVRDNVSCPTHSKLRRNLSLHYQLRDIMSDPEREVLLVNLNNPAETDRVRYQAGNVTQLWAGEVHIPGYENVSAQLKVGRLSECCEDSNSDPYRPSGILIKGRRAIYENTLFSSESNQYAGWLHGTLTCAYIDQLAIEFDALQSAGQPPTTENPVPIIGRTRDNLRHEHPFYVSLRNEVDKILRALVAAEEERVKKNRVEVENAETRADLDRMAREIGRFMQDELRESEAEPLPSAGDGEEASFQIIPGEATCYLGEPKTLSVVISEQGLNENPSIVATVEPEGVVELVDGSIVALKPHPRRPGVLIGQIHLRPLVPDVTLLQCAIENQLAEAMITVVESRGDPSPPPTPPKTLEFDSKRYRVGFMRTKSLILRAPMEVCPPGSRVTVMSTAPGLVVLTGQVAMTLDKVLNCTTGTVRVEGRVLGAQGTIRAEMNGEVAECRATVTTDEEGPGIRIEIRNGESTVYTALWEDREDPVSGNPFRVLVIQAQHPTIKRYLGDAPNFEGQNQPWTKVVIADIIADNVCREIAQRVDVTREPTDRPDSVGFYFEHYKRLIKLQPRLHEMRFPVVPS